MRWYQEFQIFTKIFAKAIDKSSDLQYNTANKSSDLQYNTANKSKDLQYNTANKSKEV